MFAIDEKFTPVVGLKCVDTIGLTAAAAAVSGIN